MGKNYFYILEYSDIVDDIKEQYIWLYRYDRLWLEDKPVRITKSSIEKATGLLAALEKKLDKLPEIKKYLEEITESVEQFQIRRCKRIIENALIRMKNLVLWKIQ